VGAPLGWAVVRELSVGRELWTRRTAFAAALAGFRLVGIVLACLGLTRAASAQMEVDDTRLTVAFSGPVECGAEDQLLQLTRGLLRNHVNHAEVRVNAAVSRRPDARYRLHLELSGSVSGERHLVADNCDAALRAAAVVIALAVNPEVFAEVSEPPPGAVGDEPSKQAITDAEAAPLQQDQPPTTLGSPQSNRERVAAGPLAGTEGRFRLGGFGRLTYGLTDEARFGARMTFGATLGAAHVRLHGFFDPTTESRDVTAGEIQFTSYGGGTDLCLRVFEDRVLGVALCGGWQLTQVSANAPELSRANQRDALVSAGIVGVSLDWTLVSDVAVVADVGVAIPTTRPRFVVDVEDGETVALSQVRPGPSAALGLQWSL